MIRNLYNEEWKPLKFDDKILNNWEFEISSFGRIAIIKQEHKYLKKKAFINGYETISLRQKVNHKTTSRYVHKLVAEHFLEKENENQIFVIHLDYDKENNSKYNLKWATKREKELHQFKNPLWIKSKQIKNISNAKLSEGKVKIIKRQLKNNRTRINIIAKRFGVSDTQIHRIKSGENWSEVKI